MDGFTTRAIGQERLRISVGLGDAGDLLAGMAQAFEAPPRAG